MEWNSRIPNDIWHPTWCYWSPNNILCILPNMSYISTSCLVKCVDYMKCVWLIPEYSGIMCNLNPNFLREPCTSGTFPSVLHASWQPEEGGKEALTCRPLCWMSYSYSFRFVWDTRSKSLKLKKSDHTRNKKKHPAADGWKPPLSNIKGFCGLDLQNKCQELTVSGPCQLAARLRCTALLFS